MYKYTFTYIYIHTAPGTPFQNTPAVTTAEAPHEPLEATPPSVLDEPLPATAEADKTVAINTEVDKVADAPAGEPLPAVAESDTPL